MKNQFTGFILGLCLSFLLLPGCSKSKSAATPASNSNANSQAAADANAASAPGGPVDLTIKWQDGKQYSMEMDLNQDTDVPLPNQTTHQELKLTQGLQFTPIKDLDNGGHDVQLEFNRQTFDMTQNGREIMTFDSSQNSTSPPNSLVAGLAKIMQAMVAVPLDYMIDANGKVQQVNGIDALKSRIAAAVPNQQQRATFQQLFDEDTLKQYGSFSESLADHPVNPGDTWPVHRDMTSAAGNVSVDMTYTFKSWEQHDDRNCVHLLATGDIKIKNPSAAMTGALVEIQKGKITGDVWFDPQLGMIVDTISDQDMTLKITTRMQTITEDMKQNVEISLTNVSP